MRTHILFGCVFITYIIHLTTSCSMPVTRHDYGGHQLLTTSRYVRID